MTVAEVFGRTVQLFLVDGSPSGLIIASIHGWTSSVSFDRRDVDEDCRRIAIRVLPERLPSKAPQQPGP